MELTRWQFVVKCAATFKRKNPSRLKVLNTFANGVKDKYSFYYSIVGAWNSIM